MNAKRQLVLDLTLRPALGREDFYVGPANEAAVAWIDKWPDWGHHAVALYGPPGCGKTHLVHVFAKLAGAEVIEAADLTPSRAEHLLPLQRPLAVENCDHLGDERALFHVFNAAKELRRTLLLTAQTPPARWQVALPDLRSRLATIPNAGISLPDDEMFSAVIVKLFADRQLAVSADVLTYIVRRIDRSFEAARKLVAAADAQALSDRRAITVPLIKSLLDSEFA